ncbi:hypothetical protein [Sphingomonas sp.]|uniref:hypothetical protein n=2 Tax=unclassified Sphingomonas TaxID=196159 RepID=UPI00257D1774|nr:hypothetical protein [Sphingomonas sp.]
MATDAVNSEPSQRGSLPAPVRRAFLTAFAWGVPMAVSTASVAAIAAPSAGPVQIGETAGLERAIANYQALARGGRRLTDLTPIEQQELAELRALLRAARSRGRDTRETCIARETAARGGTLTRLEERVVDLICSQHGG